MTSVTTAGTRLMAGLPLDVFSALKARQLPTMVQYDAIYAKLTTTLHLDQAHVRTALMDMVLMD